MTVELTEPEDLPTLEIAINVPESWEPSQEVTIEGSLDGDVVVVVAFPHNGQVVVRATVHQTLALMSQSLDQILDAMEAISE